jgi:hypothetical protein
MMKKTLSLKQYSIAAVALIGTTAAYSQVAYTDIDPDVVLDEPDEIFGIDLDDDGLNDFNFFNESFTTTVFYSDLANIRALFVGAFDTMQNGIIASLGYLSGGGGYTYFRPYPLDSGIIVGEMFNFYNDNYQTLAKIAYKTIDPEDALPGGKWYPWYGEDITNKFIGFRFIDEVESLHYGWIRCSVIDSGHTLIIHDYAYEMTQDNPIIAGDTISYVDINNHQSVANVVIYSTGQLISINCENKYFTNVNVIDMSGKVLLSKTSRYNSLEIKINHLPKGAYIVKVLVDNIAITKKIIKY